MNFLVFGGLMAVALVAIIGIVLLLMNEPGPQKQQPEQPAAPDVAVDEPVIPHQTLPARRETALSPANQQGPRLNGQFHALAAEVRTLHQQAGELEQRLSILTEVINAIEQSQGRYINIEEEARSRDDASALE